MDNLAFEMHEDAKRKVVSERKVHEMSRQSRFDARYWMLGTGALG